MKKNWIHVITGKKRFPPKTARSKPRNFKEPRQQRPNPSPTTSKKREREDAYRRCGSSRRKGEAIGWRIPQRCRAVPRRRSSHQRVACTTSASPPSPSPPPPRTLEETHGCCPGTPPRRSSWGIQARGTRADHRSWLSASSPPSDRRSPPSASPISLLSR